MSDYGTTTSDFAVKEGPVTTGQSEVEEEKAYREQVRNAEKRARGGGGPKKGSEHDNKTSAGYDALSYELSIAAAKNKMTRGGNVQAALIYATATVGDISDYAIIKEPREIFWKAFEDCMKKSGCTSELLVMKAFFSAFFGGFTPDMDTSKSLGATFAEYAYNELPSDLRKQLDQKGNEKAKEEFVENLEHYGNQMGIKLGKGLSDQEKYRLMAQAGANLGRTMSPNRENGIKRKDGEIVVQYTNKEGKKFDLADASDLGDLINDTLGRLSTKSGEEWPFKVKTREPKLISPVKAADGPDAGGTAPPDGPTGGTPPAPAPAPEPEPSGLDPVRAADIAALFKDAGITPEQFNELIAGLDKKVERDGETLNLKVTDNNGGEPRVLTKDELSEMAESVESNATSANKIAAFKKANAVANNLSAVLLTVAPTREEFQKSLNTPNTPDNTPDIDKLEIIINGDGTCCYYTDPEPPKTAHPLSEVIAFLTTKQPERLGDLHDKVMDLAKTLGITPEGKKFDELLMEIFQERWKEAEKATPQNRMVTTIVGEAVKHGAVTLNDAEQAKKIAELKGDPEALKKFIEETINRRAKAALKALSDFGVEGLPSLQELVSEPGLLPRAELLVRGYIAANREAELGLLDKTQIDDRANDLTDKSEALKGAETRLAPFEEMSAREVAQVKRVLNDGEIQTTVGQENFAEDLRALKDKLSPTQVALLKAIESSRDSRSSAVERCEDVGEVVGELREALNLDPEATLAQKTPRQRGCNSR